jgi:AcrR family transcriptional regulator
MASPAKAPGELATPSDQDGRAARSRRTRLAIVDAAIRLIEAGDVAPTARAMAEEAGVSERTLFVHFADLEELHAATAERHLQAEVLAHRPIDPHLPLADRLRSFTRQRGRALERMTPLRLVALRFEQGSPALQRSRLRWAALARSELQSAFAGELRAADHPRATLAAAQAATSWAAWDQLRTAQGLSPGAASAAMRLALERILDG